MKEMKFIIVLFLSVSVACFGQDDNRGTIKVHKLSAPTRDSTIEITNESFIQIPEGTQEINDTTIYTIVEEMPKFPGGEAEMMKFIQKNLIYPKTELDGGFGGTIYISFVVNKDGNVSNFKIIKPSSIYKAYDNEALRVVKLMPKWEPGKNNGKVVRVRYNLPIRICLK